LIPRYLPKHLKNRQAMLKKTLIIFVLTLIIASFSCESLAGEVKDETGRKVTVMSNPQRIISLAPGITETLYALNLGNKIVGVTNFCNWPAQVAQKPKIGGFINPSIEKIVALQPDLIIATADGNRKDTVQQLERIGLTVYVINQVDTAGILASILHIGEITSEKEVAVMLVGRLRQRLNNVTAQTRGKIKPRIFFQIGLDPVITSGSGTLINEVIGLAGGINIAGLDTARYPRYSPEGIIAGAPDIVLFAPMSGDREFAAVKNFWRKFKEIPAVKNNRIYPIETDLISRASPRIIDAIETMALIFHPEIKIPKSK
jgi:iron complex transport system substrate-binding protein